MSEKSYWIKLTIAHTLGGNGRKEKLTHEEPTIYKISWFGIDLLLFLFLC